MGVAVDFVDICDLAAVEQKIAESKPGCIVMETISNPLLRVGDLDRIAELARAAGAALLVDNTFATPLLVRPLEHGANFAVHSLTKYLAGHGDVLGGVVVTDEAHADVVRALSRTMGPVLGPFESYLYDARHQDFCAAHGAAVRKRLPHRDLARSPTRGLRACTISPIPAILTRPSFAACCREGLYGAMVAFEIKDAAKQEVFRFMDKLKLVVRGTSLGDVHSLMLYPAIARIARSRRKQRQRMGIGDGLVRLCAGIEAVDDIIADLDQALS